MIIAYKNHVIATMFSSACTFKIFNTLRYGFGYVYSLKVWQLNILENKANLHRTCGLNTTRLFTFI